MYADNHIIICFVFFTKCLELFEKHWELVFIYVYFQKSKENFRFISS